MLESKTFSVVGLESLKFPINAPMWIPNTSPLQYASVQSNPRLLSFSAEVMFPQLKLLHRFKTEAIQQWGGILKQLTERYQYSSRLKQQN
jgi:hypothetical protein